ncbi:MAG: helix-turn-helix domain-containing protein [Planctomycetes bacterium]|nr:helix-turn-helix domain-containing protein [Planctomycetota bacterium]
MPPMRRPVEREACEAAESSYSLTHLAKRWNKSRREVRQMLQHGELPFEQVDGQIRVPCQAVEQFEKNLQRPVGHSDSD